MKLINKFKILTGICDPELLETYLEVAKERVLDLTNRKNYISDLDSITLEVAVVLFNRIGTEGETSRSEGGISISYNELPYSLQKRIETKRLARVGGHAFEKEQIEEVQPISEDID